MPVPKHYKLVVDAAFFATGDKRISKFVRMVIGKEPCKQRANGIGIGVFCFFKINVRQYAPSDGCNGNLSMCSLTKESQEPVLISGQSSSG